jgi:hypothetical protein
MRDVLTGLFVGTGLEAAFFVLLMVLARLEPSEEQAKVTEHPAEEPPRRTPIAPQEDERPRAA